MKISNLLQERDIMGFTSGYEILSLECMEEIKEHSEKRYEEIREEIRVGIDQALKELGEEKYSCNIKLASDEFIVNNFHRANYHLSDDIQDALARYEEIMGEKVTSFSCKWTTKDDDANWTTIKDKNGDFTNQFKNGNHII